MCLYHKMCFLHNDDASPVLIRLSPKLESAGSFFASNSLRGFEEDEDDCERKRYELHDEESLCFSSVKSRKDILK